MQHIVAEIYSYIEYILRILGTCTFRNRDRQCKQKLSGTRAQADYLLIQLSIGMAICHIQLQKFKPLRGEKPSLCQHLLQQMKFTQLNTSVSVALN